MNTDIESLRKKVNEIRDLVGQLREQRSTLDPESDEEEINRIKNQEREYQDEARRIDAQIAGASSPETEPPSGKLEKVGEGQSPRRATQSAGRSSFVVALEQMIQEERFQEVENAITSSQSLDDETRARLFNLLRDKRAIFIDQMNAEFASCLRDGKIDRATLIVDELNAAIGDAPEHTQLRKQIVDAEYHLIFRRIVNALRLDEPESHRPTERIDWVIPELDKLEFISTKDDAFAARLTSIAELRTQFEDEYKRRSVAWGISLTHSQQGQYAVMREKVELDRSLGLRETTLYMPVVASVDETGVISELQLQTRTIEDALAWIDQQLERVSSEAIDRRVLDARVLLDSDIEEARKKLTDARKFWEAAGAKQRKELEGAEDELRAREQRRAAIDGRLAQASKLGSLRQFRERFDEIRSEDPSNPKLAATVAAIVERFRGQLIAQVGGARAQGPALGKRALDSAAADLEILQGLLPEAQADTVAGEARSLADDAWEALGAISRRVDDARRVIEEDARRETRWQAARAMLQDWLASPARDLTVGEELLASLQDNLSDEVRGLILRAEPVMAAELEADRVRKLLRESKPSEARVVLAGITRGIIDARRLRALSDACDQAEAFLRVQNAVRQATSAAVVEASDLLAGLAGNTDDGIGVSQATLASVRNEVERLKADASRNSSYLADARGHLQTRRHAQAWAAVDAIRTELSDIAADKRTLAAEIEKRWRDSASAVLRDAVSRNNSERICQELAEVSGAFGRVDIDQDVARACFDTLARTWEQEGIHVERLDRAVRHAAAVCTSPEDRERLDRGVREVVRRRDLPAIRNAVDERNYDRARELLEVIDPVIVGYEVLAPLWVEVLVARREFDGARVWVERLKDASARAALGRHVDDAEAGARQIEDIDHRIETSIRALETERDAARITKAVRDMESALSSRDARERAPLAIRRWEEALRGFEIRQLARIDQAEEGAGGHEAFAPYEMLLAIGRLTPVLKLEYERLAREAREPIRAALSDSRMLLALPNPDRAEVARVQQAVEALLLMLAGRHGDAAKADLQDLQNADTTVRGLATDLESLFAAQLLLTRLRPQVRDEAGIEQLKALIQQIPVRFTGSPSHPVVEAMRRELRATQIEWEADHQLVGEIVAAWSRRSYLECEQRAGRAANDILINKDSFKLKETVSIRHNGRPYTGAKEIRDLASTMRSMQSEWERHVADIRQGAPTGQEVARVQQEFSGPRRYDAYLDIANRGRQIIARCDAKLDRLGTDSPRDPDGVLTEADTAQWRSGLRELGQQLSEWKAVLEGVVVQLDDDEKLARELLTEIERLRRELAAATGGWWSRPKPDPAKQEALDQAIARYRALRPAAAI